MWPIASSSRAAGGDRVDDEVDRHDVEQRVGVADLRQRPALQRGQRAQHVVGPVELLGLAGPRVADHDRRAVDRRRDALAHRRADEHLGGELRRLVVVLELLALVELGLEHDAGARARDVRGGDVVVALQPRAGAAEVEHHRGADDVHALGDRRPHGEVVDRGEVVHRDGLGGQALVRRPVEAHPHLGDVARLDGQALAQAQARGGLLGAADHARLDERDDPRAGVVGQQPRDQPGADEAREAGEQDRPVAHEMTFVAARMITSMPTVKR